MDDESQTRRMERWLGKFPRAKHPSIILFKKILISPLAIRSARSAGDRPKRCQGHRRRYTIKPDQPESPNTAGRRAPEPQGYGSDYLFRLVDNKFPSRFQAAPFGRTPAADRGPSAPRPPPRCLQSKAPCLPALCGSLVLAVCVVGREPSCVL